MYSQLLRDLNKALSIISLLSLPFISYAGCLGTFYFVIKCKRNYHVTLQTKLCDLLKLNYVDRHNGLCIVGQQIVNWRLVEVYFYLRDAFCVYVASAYTLG